MRSDSDISINKIITLISQFIAGKRVNLDVPAREDPKIFHYYTEIVRYWSGLNFILKKTLRSLDLYNLPQNEIALYLYIIFRKFQEGASKKSLIEEISLSANQTSNSSRFIDKLETFSWEVALKSKTHVEILSIKESIPTFVIDHLLPVIPFELLKENIQYMNDHQKYNNFFRISNLKLKKSNQSFLNSLKKELNSYNISLKQDREIPELFYIPHDKKRLILKISSYRSSQIIFQDKASASVIKILAPQPFENIYDMCAAPGIKTNLIAYYTSNQARVISGEFLTKRAVEMSKFIKRTNDISTHLINCDSIQFPLRFHDRFDRILLDAPCTGSGTFISNPELKWRQNNNFLYQNVTIQEKLIESALSLLKPNGIFVYSTCSLYPEEGELQILKFNSMLKPLQLPKWISPSYEINGQTVPGTGRLFPSTHHTHGFFIGKFQKKYNDIIQIG